MSSLADSSLPIIKIFTYRSVDDFFSVPNGDCPGGSFRFMHLCYEIRRVDSDMLIMYYCKGSQVAVINSYYLNQFLWNHIRRTGGGYFLAKSSPTKVFTNSMTSFSP